MKILSCVVTIDVTFEGNPGLSGKLLDQSGFPWMVESSRGDLDTGNVTLGIRPLRVVRSKFLAEVRELYPYDVRLLRAHQERVYDYMASIEALDVNIKQICTNEVTELSLHGHLEQMHARDADTPKDFVVIGAIGFQWGPLPLSPMEEPIEWPFPAVSVGGTRPVTLQPCLGGSHYDVKAGPLTARLPWREGVDFADALVRMDWEKAVEQLYPHGMNVRLSPIETRP